MGAFLEIKSRKPPLTVSKNYNKKMAVGFGQNFENIAYVYINLQPHLWKSVDHEFFKSPTLKALSKLTKQFYERFHEQIFSPENPSVEQIEYLVMEDKKSFMIDLNMSEDDNAKTFIANASYIIKTNIKAFSEEWLDETVGAWIMWQNNQRAYKESISYMQTQNITPENVKEVISKAREIVVRGSSLSFGDEEVFDFYDPQSHKQISVEDYIDTGYEMLNQMLTEDRHNGFIPGTLNMFMGSTNSGKSVILGNLALNISRSGKNVLFVSVEMSIPRTFRRIGSNAFDIPISEYDTFSNDDALLSESIKKFRAKNMNIGVPPGKFLALKFPKTGVSNIYGTAKRLEEKHGIKWHAIVIDYFTELQNDHGTAQDKTYQYHKQNADDLYQMASETNWCVITAHQLNRGALNMSDMTLSSVAESYGIVYRCDSVIGMIATEKMQVEHTMYMKNLKCRDSKYKNFFAKFDTEFSKMRIIETGELISPEDYQIFT